MPGNALNRETWSQLSDVSCPNNSWTAGYGDASWQISTNAECVAAAEADASCATPLVLNIGWDACYCATDACDAPVATSYMTTFRYAGDGQGLAPLGEHEADELAQDERVRRHLHARADLHRRRRLRVDHEDERRPAARRRQQQDQVGEAPRELDGGPVLGAVGRAAARRPVERRLGEGCAREVPV